MLVHYPSIAIIIIYIRRRYWNARTELILEKQQPAAVAHGSCLHITTHIIIETRGAGGRRVGQDSAWLEVVTY